MTSDTPKSTCNKPRDLAAERREYQRMLDNATSAAMQEYMRGRMLCDTKEREMP